MVKKFKVKPIYKTLALLLAIIVIVGLLAGCGTRGAVARGWAGGVISGDTLYVGSMTGDIVSVNLMNDSIDETIPVEDVQASSGFFSGCSAGSAAVVMYGSPAIAGDLIYVAGYNTGKMYAISASTQLKTQEDLQKDADSSPSNIVGGPVVYGGKVFIGSTDGYVYALETVSLKYAWSEPFKTGDKIWSTPAVINDTVYIGSFDKKMYALNVADGSLKWEFQTEGAIVSTPLVEGNTVYFGSFDRYMYALDATTGALKWKYKADNWFWAKPVINDGDLYAPCLDGKVYVLDTATGQKVQQFDLENAISSAPVIVDGQLVVATQSDLKNEHRSLLYVIDLATGTKDAIQVFSDENKSESVFANLIAGNGKVYIQSTLNKVYEVDVASGAKKEIVIETASEE